MPATSNITLSIASSDILFSGGGRTRPLTIRRSARARRMTLAVDPRDGMVRLTVPHRMALGSAMAWAREKRGWIEAQLAALPAPAIINAGGTFPFEGVELSIRWSADHGRSIRRDGDALLVGGPAELMAGRVLRWAKAQAAMVLDRETRAMAAAHGLTVGRVGVGDPRSRWGSCTGAGDIRYSWRLILAPPDVRRATIAHELGHRLHMDHSAAFHAAVERLYGRCPKPERAWLKANGARLHAVGREG